MYRKTAKAAVLLFILVHGGWAKKASNEQGDPFQQRIAGIQLNEQSVIDGVAMLSQRANVVVSVEFPLGETISGPAPQLRTFNKEIEPGTVSEVLDRLCSLDPTFVWIRIGDVLHVLPRVRVNDPSYVLNGRFDEVSFHNVSEASDAIMRMVGQLPGPREQLAVMQVGPSLDFAVPWKATLRDVTVREVIDRVAYQLGSAYSWQLGGADDFRIVTFHEKLLPKPSRSKPIAANEKP